MVEVGALGVGYQIGDGVPDRGWGSSQGWVTDNDGVPGMGWGSRHGMGFQTGVGYQTQVGFQTWDDGVPDR